MPTPTKSGSPRLPLSFSLDRVPRQQQRRGVDVGDAYRGRRCTVSMHLAPCRAARASRYYAVHAKSTPISYPVGKIPAVGCNATPECLFQFRGFPKCKSRNEARLSPVLRPFSHSPALTRFVLFRASAGNSNSRTFHRIFRNFDVRFPALSDKISQRSSPSCFHN